MVGAPIDVGLGTVLEERPWKNCSAFPEGQLWLNPVTARSLKPVRLSQGGATGELGGHSCITFLLNFVLVGLHGAPFMENDGFSSVALGSP